MTSNSDLSGSRWTDESALELNSSRLDPVGRPTHVKCDLSDRRERHDPQPEGVCVGLFPPETAEHDLPVAIWPAEIGHEHPTTIGKMEPHFKPSEVVGSLPRITLSSEL